MAGLRSTRKLFNKAYVISLNTNGPRFKKTQRYAKNAGLKLHVVPGVEVSNSMIKKGIPGITRRHFKNRGIVGCYVAHRKVLEQIANSKPTAEGTIVLEDDVVIPTDFKKQLRSIKGSFPKDWDIVYLGQNGKTDIKVAEGLYKARPWMGTYAYLVRNKSIKKRILPVLQTMKQAVNHQFFSGDLNLYTVWPNMINYNKSTRSNIKRLNKLHSK